MKNPKDGYTRAYKPTPKDWRYVWAFREAILEGGPLRRTDVMEKMGFTHRSTLSRYEANEERMAWIRAQLYSGQELRWEMLLESAYSKAVKGKGNVKWAIFFGRGVGRLG